MAGAGAALATRFINHPMVPDAAYLAVGYFRNNNTLKTLGAAGLGADLVNMFPGGTNLGGAVQGAAW